MTYRLRVAARAIGDADEAYAWIAENVSPVQAERWYEGLFRQMDSLTRHPTRCPRAAESERFTDELRQLLYGRGRNKHRIIFTIRGDDVVVLYIHHVARRDLEP